MAPRLSKEQKDNLTEARKTQILDAALRVWAEKGADVATVDSIAKEAGLAKGTVYLYFKTKQEILQGAVERFVAPPEQLDKLIELLSPDLPIALPDMMRFMATFQLAAVRQRSSSIAFVIREIFGRPEYAEHVLRALVDRIDDHGIRFFEKYVDRGAMRDDLDLFAASRAFGGMLLTFMATHIYLSGGSYPRDDTAIADAVVDIFLHGVVPRDEPADGKTPGAT